MSRIMRSGPVRGLNRLNTNTWNRIRYSAWAPFYDVVTGGFDRYRRESLARLQLSAGERVLLVGAGNGLRALNVVSAVLFTEVTRRFEDIFAATNSPLSTELDEPAALGGLFRHILLRRNG
jgi:hypothetical protein